MRPALSSLERRLGRVAAWFDARIGAAERDREVAAARATMAALIREGLVRAGLDPAQAVALHRFAAPAPPRPLPRLRRPDPDAVFADRMRALAARMDRPPPLATASPAELFAYYCCGPGAREAPAEA